MFNLKLSNEEFELVSRAVLYTLVATKSGGDPADEAKFQAMHEKLVDVRYSEEHYPSFLES